MDFVSVQIDQIDTGKGTFLQRSSLIHYLPSPMFLNLKYREKGTMSNISQWFVKAPIANPRSFLFPLLSKAALRGIYVAGIDLSFLNFPCLTPFQCLRECYLPQRGIFRGLTPLLEKEMATHSSVLAWRIPGTGEPGGLLSMGSHRVGHDWSDLAAAAAPHSSPGLCVDIVTLALLSVILHFQDPQWAPLAAASTVGRDRKWSTHSLGKLETELKF